MSKKVYFKKDNLLKYLKEEGDVYITNGPCKKDLISLFGKDEKISFEILLKNKRSYRIIFLKIEKLIHIDTEKIFFLKFKNIRKIFAYYDTKIKKGILRIDIDS